MSILEDKGVNTTSIESLGEFGLIDHLTNGIITKNSSTVKGVGDDAAASSPTPLTVELFLVIIPFVK